jgi:hypothetical protein
MLFPSSALTSPFETIFRWGKRWTSIHVKPITENVSVKHFKVTLIDGSSIFLWKDPQLGWEESSGNTERSRILGWAIEEFYKLT